MDVVNRPAVSGSLKFLTGPLAGTTLPISKPITTLGRDETSNDIVISDPAVSRHHARIVQNGSQWMIEKLAPQNTVSVNSRDVQQAPISDRDTIGLGTGTTFLFQVTPVQSASAGAPPAAQQSSAPSWAMQSQQTPSYAPGAFPSPPLPTPQPPLYTATEPAEAGTQRAPLPGAVNGAPSGVPSIEVSSNVHAEKQTFLLNKPVINIGREPSNDIVISELVVSGFHAQIVQEGNQFVLIHPHPSRPRTLNGLLYQGRHIAGDQPFRKPLGRGDVFRIGDEHGTLVTLTFNDGSGTVQEAVPEIRPIPLGAPVITLGRLPDNNVVLNHPQVSGHHARLERVGNNYRIVDLHSTNHVYVNGHRVSTHMLKPGDEIHMGAFRLIFTGTELTQHDESQGIRIDALQLRKVGNNNTVLINDISVAIPPRKFVALVGGSGAGKSTLMDALNGLRPAQKGTVLYNGKDYYHHLAAFSTQLGYVPQDDIIHRDLTVERALYYAAKLRLPNDFTKEQIKARIEEVLEDVELKGRRHLLVSKLSGGQRKRVSIALELLANPSVFFLDEPTSGLDPGLDRKMMVLLRKLADKGHTVLLVTHATNNINICDAVCFLAQGGRLAYFGPPEEAKAYFQQPDFAEIYNCLEPTDEHPNIPQEAEERFRRSAAYQTYIASRLKSTQILRSAQNDMAPTYHSERRSRSSERSEGEEVARPKQFAHPKQYAQKGQRQQKAPRRGSFWRQFLLLCQRYLELLWNDKWNLSILLLQAPVIGFILFILVLVLNERTVFKQPIPFLLQGDAQHFLFILAFAAIMFGTINSAREIIKELHIYQRERTVNLGILPYLLSKIIVLGVLCLVQCAVLLLLMS